MDYLFSQLNLQSLQTLRVFGFFTNKANGPRKKNNESRFDPSHILGFIFLIFILLQAGQCFLKNILLIIQHIE